MTIEYNSPEELFEILANLFNSYIKILINFNCKVMKKILYRVVAYLKIYFKKYLTQNIKIPLRLELGICEYTLFLDMIESFDY